MLDDTDVEELVERVRAAQLEWANGRLDPLFDLTRGTIFGPFGGPAVGGTGLGELQTAIAEHFHDGTSELEVVQTIIGGDVVCLVLVEGNSVRFDADLEPRRWTLRVTMVFQREADAWVLLHRHADPLIDGRDLGATLDLLPRS